MPLGTRDRETLSRCQRFQSVAPSLGGRADFWLAWALSPLEQGLRGLASEQRITDLCCHGPPDAQAFDSSTVDVAPILQFPNRLLGFSETIHQIGICSNG